MGINYLRLPVRTAKPRLSGVTMVIDNGLPSAYFADVISSHGDHVDFVKFGWGTSVVSKEIKGKIEAVRREGVEFYFGGSLFEKYIVQDRFDEFRWMCQEYGCNYVEVSNGTISLEDSKKAQYVAELSKDFRVISEVGSKLQMKSENMAPSKWIGYISEDLAAGAVLVTLETRESGHGGMCRPNGELRFGLVEEILDSGFDTDLLLFEAPSMALQSYFVKRIGPNVNLGNIQATDIVGLETIRLGLRSETLVSFEPDEVRRLHLDQ
ncbi:MAG: phosphosulfolactate synthase [Acidimicrobiaceae bacterium]|nr:phosphosulfolactate synthase [Acidimicrobiaceae bacterium]